MPSSQGTSFLPCESRKSLYTVYVVDTDASRTDALGNAILTVEKNTRQLGGTIQRVYARHAAQYRNDSQSVLSVRMFRCILRLDRQETGKKASAFHGSTDLKNAGNPGVGAPTQWYELSIYSAKALHTFQENCNLKFGDTAKWTPSALEAEGVFEGLCKPGLGMIPSMNQTGMYNNNGQASRGNPATMTLTMRDKKKEASAMQFW